MTNCHKEKGRNINPTSKKSENDNAGRDLAVSGLSGSLLPGVTLQQLLARASTSQVPQRLTNMNSGTRFQKCFKRLDQALIKGLWPENVLTRLYRVQIQGLRPENALT